MYDAVDGVYTGIGDPGSVAVCISDWSGDDSN